MNRNKRYRIYARKYWDHRHDPWAMREHQQQLLTSVTLGLLLVFVVILFFIVFAR